MKDKRKAIIRAGIGAGVTVLTSIAILIAASVLIAKGSIPESAAKPIIITACAIGSALGSSAAVRGKNPSRSAAAAGQGAVCAVLMLIAGALMSGESGMGGFVPAVLCTLLIPAVSAALLTRKRRRKHR